jgi:hypothetical protein
MATIVCLAHARTRIPRRGARAAITNAKGLVLLGTCPVLLGTCPVLLGTCPVLLGGCLWEGAAVNDRNVPSVRIRE